MNVITGECMFFHENGNYWSYKKYNIEETSLKWASQNSSPGSEL